MKNIVFTQPKASTTILTITGVILLCALGTWQLNRLAWKTEILDKISAQSTKSPIPLPEKIKKIEDWNYRPVTIAGEFLHDKAIYLQPRSLHDRPGGHIVTPFRRISGDIVLINRGWVPKDKINNFQKPLGIIQISARGKIPQVKRAFTPDNIPAKNEWYWLDPKAVEKQIGKTVFPLILYQVASNDNKSYPRGGQLYISYPNNHLGYALFWFGMAGILIFMYGLAHISRISSQKITP